MRLLVLRWLSVLACGAVSTALQAATLSGSVVDLDARPVAQAQVTLTTPGKQGDRFTTVFADQEGRFTIVDPPLNEAGVRITARALRYEPAHKNGDALSGESLARALKGEPVAIVMRPQRNLASVASASEWLRSVPAGEKAQIVMTCVGCHQFPAPEVRAFANMMDDAAFDHEAERRAAGWNAAVSYMNYMFADFRSKSWPGKPMPADLTGVYNTAGMNEMIVDLITRNTPPRMERIEQADYGAPLAVTAKTVIREYEVPSPNSVREAVLFGNPLRLWVVDIGNDSLVSIDPATGAQKSYRVPYDGETGPHTIVPSDDGTLWVTMIYNSLVAQFDPRTEKWTMMQAGKDLGSVIHDISFDYRGYLLPDRKGRIWYSDAEHNGLGYIDPKTNESGRRIAPVVNELPQLFKDDPFWVGMYGVVMASDRKTLCYTQLGGGGIGCFNTDTMTVNFSFKLPPISGPRRMAISDKDMVYVALFGSGQIVEFNARTGKDFQIFDLPDRAAAPYAVTWDPVRRVVWVANSNSDSLYRFDPATKNFAVLPLPRQQALLRMLAVEPKSGLLVTSYANTPINAKGPRMAVVIDPGHGRLSKREAP